MKRSEFIRPNFFSQTRRDQFWRFASGCVDNKPFSSDHILEKREIAEIDWIFDGIKYQIDRRSTMKKDNFSWSHYDIYVNFDAGVVRVYSNWLNESYFDIPIKNIYRGLV